MQTLLKTKHHVLKFGGDWEASLGQPEMNFRMFVWGLPGGGKTTFTLKLAKYLTKFGKVLYCGFEEANGSSFKKAVERSKLWEAGDRIKLAYKTQEEKDHDKPEIEQLIELLKKRNSAQFVVIDSLDYMGLTKKDFTQLDKLFPKKSFIILSWASGSSPKTSAGVSIRHMCGIKVHVKDLVAYVVSRYGGNEPFEISN